MEETISRIVSSSSTTRIRSLAMALSECIAHIRLRLHIPKVTKWTRKSGNDGEGPWYLKGWCLCVYRALIYESCLDIWEFGWRADRPLVDGAGNRRPDRGGGQSAFLPGISGTISADVGSEGGRIARRFEVDGGNRAGRLCAGDGVVCGRSTDVGTGAAGSDGASGGIVGTDGLRRHAAALFSGFEGPRAGVGSSMPADCSRGSRRTAAVPVRARWTGAIPVRGRAAHVESELASIH